MSIPIQEDATRFKVTMEDSRQVGHCDKTGELNFQSDPWWWSCAFLSRRVLLGLEVTMDIWRQAGHCDKQGLKLLKRPIQEDVARLEVTMDDWRQAMFMKELQTGGSSLGNAKPSRPSKASSVVEKSIQNRIIRHVIAHQHGAIACNSLEESSEGHYVGMLNWGSTCNIAPNLLVNEHARFLCMQSLDGHIAMIVLQLPLNTQTRNSQT